MFVLLRSRNLEMVFVLLIVVITFYVQMTMVKIGVSRLERFIKIISSFDKWGCRSLISDLFDISLHKLLEKVII